MTVKISDLLARYARRRVNRDEILRDENGRKYSVLKSIWVFKLNRLPDGSSDRYKAKFYVRGDMQKKGIDFFDTYALVVKWGTIRM